MLNRSRRVSLIASHPEVTHMSRTKSVMKIVMAFLAPVALLGSIQAGSRPLDTRSDVKYPSPTAIEDAQTILEQNQYLAPGSYRTGELDQTTISAIASFQDAHTLRPTGGLNFDTTALL